ncbi:hypothetical protein Bbelb_095330 [Branchiostoma belcheri]|nr:hypothetical protein Bbelb_095330 [Branchiostoma belcheri]
MDVPYDLQPLGVMQASTAPSPMPCQSVFNPRIPPNGDVQSTQPSTAVNYSTTESADLSPLSPDLDDLPMDAQDLFGCNNSFLQSGENSVLFGADFSPFDKFEDIPTDMDADTTADPFSEDQDDSLVLDLDPGTEENVWMFSQRLLSPLSSPSEIQLPPNHPSCPVVSPTAPPPPYSVTTPCQPEETQARSNVSLRNCAGLTLRQLVSAPPNKPTTPQVVDLTSDSHESPVAPPLAAGSQSPLYPTPPSSAQASPRKSPPNTPFHFPSERSPPNENSTPSNIQSQTVESLSTLTPPCQSPASVSVLSPPDSVQSNSSYTSSLPPSPSTSVCSLSSTEGLIQRAENTLTSAEIKARDQVKMAEVQAKTSRNYRRSLARSHDLDKLAGNLERENGELRDKIESLTSEIALVRKNIVLVMAGKMPVK